MNAIPGRQVPRLLDALLGGHVVFAPVRHGRIVAFEPIASGSDAVLGCSNSTVSPRHVLLPRMETLLTSCSGDAYARECTCPDSPVVLFGSRPCDARALTLLDRILSGGANRDVYYQRRRDLLTIVSIGCARPLETCFCTAMGGGPFSTDGSDILLEECEGSFLVHVVTERGRALASKLGVCDAGRRPGGATAAAEEETGHPAAPTGIDPGMLKGSLDASFDDPVWRAISERCIGCGICSYVCPSCHCFDIVDEEAGGSACRKRVWDSCQFASFTEQASGFNPRPTGASRYRQRIMHKFSYCIDDYGMAGCVGCGRCVTECPVNLDIREVLKAFAARGAL